MAPNYELIAGLSSDPAYLALCDFLQAQVDDTADELADATNPSDALRLLRVWQVSRKLVATLKTAPLELKTEIDQQKNRNPIEPLAAWAEIPDEEMFQRRKAPVPPPMPRKS